MHPALERLTTYGPVVLVPAAWLVVLMTVNGVIGQRPLFVAHVVMFGFLLFFLGVGWSRMEDGLLRGWRAIMAAGTVATVAGLAGFVGIGPVSFFLGASLVYWMVKPGLGLVYTGLEMDGETIYLWSGVVTLLGAGIVLASIGDLIAAIDVGLLLVGGGQSVGMSHAVAAGDDPEA
jgi:hypothetical protein